MEKSKNSEHEEYDYILKETRRLIEVLKPHMVSPHSEGKGQWLGKCCSLLLIMRSSTLSKERHRISIVGLGVTALSKCFIVVGTSSRQQRPGGTFQV